MIRAILFDFDGVLVDSEPLHYQCWVEALAPEGIHFTYEDYARRFIGVSNRAMVEALCRDRNQDFHKDFFERCYARKRALWDQRAPVVCRVPDQLRSFIASSSRIYRLGVVSSSERCEVEPLLAAQGILGHLAVLVCGEDVENLKPAPDPYLLALGLLGGIGAGECLVVEDSGPGAEAARAAGMLVIRVEGPGAVLERVQGCLASFTNRWPSESPPR